MDARLAMLKTSSEAQRRGHGSTTPDSISGSGSLFQSHKPENLSQQTTSRSIAPASGSAFKKPKSGPGPRSSSLKARPILTVKTQGFRHRYVAAERTITCQSVASNVSERSSNVSERSSNVSERSSYVSERSSYVPERSSYVSERSTFVATA